MDELPLISLRALAAVYEHQGVRAAATQLGIAHSSVSRHLVQLEKWLGVRLLERTPNNRRFVLTPQGVELARTAQAAMRSISSAAAAARESKSTGAVSVTTTPSFAARWLLPRLAKLGQEAPSLEVSVIADQGMLDLRERDIDLAIRMGSGPWSGMHCEALMDDALYPVASPALLARHGAPATARQWRAWSLIHDRDPRASWTVWREVFGPSGLDVRQGPRFTSSDLVLRAAVLSQGMALARHRIAADDVQSGALVRPFGQKSIPLRDAYWIVMPERSRRCPAVLSLVAWLKRQALKQELSV